MIIARVAPLALLLGCSTTLSTMQPVEVLPQHHIEAGVGMGGNLAPGPIFDLIKTADKIATEQNPSDQDAQDFLTAGLAIALNPPGVESEYAFRYGIGYDLDVGVRYTVNAIELGGRWQFLKSEIPGGWEGTIGVTAAHHIFTGAIFDVLDKLEINDFSRNDISVPLMFGKKKSDSFQYWLGPKYILSKYHVDSTFETTNVVDQTDGNMQYFGGSAGFAVGWRYVWFMAELSVMDLVFNANVLGQDRDLGGVVVYPAAGLLLHL